MLRSSIRVAFCAAAAFFGVGAQVAEGAQITAIGTESLEGEMRSYFPDSLERGWAPVQVFLKNRGPKRREVTLELTSDRFTNSMARSSQSRSMDLGPGESREVEFYVPCDREGGSQSYSFTVESKQERTYLHLGLNGDDMPLAGRVICLVRGGGFSGGEVAAAHSVLPNNPSTGLRGVGSGLIWGSSGWSSPSGAGAQGAAAFPLEPSQFPRRSMGWSSVDTMICDTSRGLEPTRNWKAVADWVRMGGQVVFSGTDAAETASMLPGIKDLLDGRFLLGDPKDGTSVYRAGFGLLSVTDHVGLPRQTADWRKLLGPLDAALPTGIDEAGRDDNPSFLGSIYRDLESWREPLERKSLPVRLVLGFLMVFALAIGPGNVWYTRKKKRPDMMFLLVPGLSVLATLMLLGYGIGREGFSIKGNAHSLAILDQREDGLTTTFLRRELFAGRGGYALEPRPGSLVMVKDPGRDDVLRRISDDGASMRLGGGFLPAREQSEHLIARVAPARVRVEVKALAGGGIEVSNGLGVDIEALELQTPDGRWMRSPGPILSGASGALEPTSGPALGDELRASGDPLFAAADPPAGGYLAVVSASPTADDCSVPMKELSSRHAVVGILPSDSKGWTR